MFSGLSKALSALWKLISKGDDEYTNVALAIAAAASVAVVGLFLVALYGWFAPAPTFAPAPPFPRVSTDWYHRLSSALLAVMAASCAFLAGSAVGFLFGMPRWTDAQLTAAETVQASEGALGTANAQRGAQGNVLDRIRPNTSLERVTDWLTTIIVGLGLVHLGDIKREVTDVGFWLTAAITHQQDSNATPGVLIVTGFSILGFLFFYLWATRFLPREMSGLYQRQEIKKARDSAEQAQQDAKAAKAQAESSRTAIERLQNEPRFALSAGQLTHYAAMLTEAGFPDGDVTDVIDRLSRAKTWNDDPFKDFGPASTDQFTLTAKVVDSTEYVGNFDLGIWIQRTEKTLPVQKVAYLLHHTYFPSCIDVINGAASAEPRQFGPVAEAFVVGALVLGEGQQTIRLSLDLETLRDVPEGFRTLPVERQ